VTGGVFLFFAKAIVFELRNLDHPRTVRIRISPSEPFSLLYTHSIYREPVAEEFEVVEGQIILKGVRTAHAGVMEYYGFEEVKPFHTLHKPLPRPLIIKRGMEEAQRLMIKNMSIPFDSLGEKGDRIQLDVYALPWVSYWYSKLHDEG
jgi:hypothetical protein